MLKFKLKHYPQSRPKSRKDYTDPRKKDSQKNSPKPKKRKVPAPSKKK